MALARARMSARMRARPRQRALRGAPGAAGEVADLGFHDGSVGSVVLLPARVFLAGLGVLQGGFMLSAHPGWAPSA